MFEFPVRWEEIAKSADPVAAVALEVDNRRALEDRLRDVPVKDFTVDIEPLTSAVGRFSPGYRRRFGGTLAMVELVLREPARAGDTTIEFYKDGITAGDKVGELTLAALADEGEVFLGVIFPPRSRLYLCFSDVGTDAEAPTITTWWI